MKNNHFPPLPVSGLERSYHSLRKSDDNTHLGSGLVVPGWSTTSRRTRPGKARMIFPASNRALSMSENQKTLTWTTRPRKSLMCIPVSDRALSASDNEKPSSRITTPGKDLMCIPVPDQALTAADNDFPVLENAENLPPKKRKLESDPVSSNIPGNSNSKGPFPNGPLIIHGKSGKDDRILYPGLNDDEKPVRAHKHYACNACDRSFKSYQALGGHKSHHNHKVHEILSPCEDNESSTTVVEYVARAEGWGSVAVHRCPFCDRVFSKGQALGGHKRHCRHGQEARNGPGPRGFSFDLNELPPEWITDGSGSSGMACEWSMAYK